MSNTLTKSTQTPHTNADFHAIDQQVYLPTFRRYPITLARGKGARVWDVEGKEYIDALAGIAVTNVGHAHPKVVKAIQDQAAALTHISNFFLSEPQVALSQKLVALSGLNRIFFCNSGAEAVEGAIKVARKHAQSRGRGGTVVTLKGAFHGRTLATVAATGKKAMQQGFEPIPAGFIQVPFNDIQTLESQLSPDWGAVLIEPIQGEGGVTPAEREYLKALRQFCDTNHLTLIFDEVQTGVGRTGEWFAKDHYGVQPDVMSLAKGLGGGVPIGAFLCSEAVSQAIDYGDHGTTFGGNPLVCAAALATLDVIEEENLLAHARDLGHWLKQEVESWQLPMIQKVRGAGLMWGIVLTIEAKPIAAALLDQGILANATAQNVLRLVPPLNISRSELQQVLEKIKLILKEVTA